MLNNFISVIALVDKEALDGSQKDVFILQITIKL